MNEIARKVSKRRLEEIKRSREIDAARAQQSLDHAVSDSEATLTSTDKHRAYAILHVQDAAEMGVEYMRWVTGGVNVRTGRETCWRCAPMEGKLVPVSEARVGIRDTDRTLLPVRDGCRCRLVAVMRPEELPADEFLDAMAIAAFRDSVRANDPSLHPFPEEAQQVKAQTDQQHIRAERLRVIHQIMTTKGGARGETRKALQAERIQLKAESQAHLERRLHEFQQCREQVRKDMHEARRTRYATLKSRLSDEIEIEIKSEIR